MSNYLSVLYLCVLFFIGTVQADTHAAPQAELISAYGKAPSQFGELRLPAGQGPHPVIILIHGGCWLAQHSINSIRSLASAFTQHGIATWSIEYRRVGNDGGGWPNTFYDINQAAAHLNSLASHYPLDLNRVIIVGHSSGAHLGMWLTNPPSDVKSKHKIPAIKGIIALAPAVDLTFLHKQGVCDNVIKVMLGGSPQQVPARYTAASVIKRVPKTLAQHIILGEDDHYWSMVGKRYLQAATNSKANISFTSVPEVDHLELIDPNAKSWPSVLSAVKQLLDQ